MKRSGVLASGWTVHRMLGQGSDRWTGSGCQHSTYMYQWTGSVYQHSTYQWTGSGYQHSTYHCWTTSEVIVAISMTLDVVEQSLVPSSQIPLQVA